MFSRNSHSTTHGPTLYSPPAILWPVSPHQVNIEAEEIHLWCASLGDFEEGVFRLEALLAPDERERAGKFHFLSDRRNYTLRRGLLRLLLSKYLTRPPREITFQYGRLGKPELDPDRIRQPIAFNASQSQGLAVYAVSRPGPIGVDVEKVREVPHFEEIANRFFSKREAESLMKLPRESRLEAFFTGWTRKEALLKSTGEGVGERMATVEVTLIPGGVAEILSFKGEAKPLSDWYLHSFSPAPGYLTAIAVKGRPAHVSLWKLPGSWITSI